MTPDILLERDGPIATVTLFNPDKLNAVTAAMWRRLRLVMDDLSADDSLRCVVLRGESGAFAAGGDIDEFVTLRDTFEKAQVYHGEWVAGALQAVAECRHPTVAAIVGPCIGGGLEIAAACDLRIAGAGAKFGAPIMKLGFPMYAGELAGLLALAGPAVVLEILLEGRILSAREAYEKRLLTRVVADTEVRAEAMATARRIAAGAPLVARQHKQLVRRLTAATNALSATELRDNFAFLESDDYREGLAAFFDKRPPNFTGT
ncbi:MAG: enoyl-CoA hydratase/isomerase family protein [Gammaproteobacteria bacterium]|nr:enoyl-CoA hydratase/isomerase family protein [Gammaproteobacteria bacterium]MBU1647697.1 enoyl-CoA hydratase/isomerase family protein [Gammaproteobacteria bacterium]MBU1971843.1 enoyl-CoA hydratase/isomerase family protein [Gammaproteobacteria bacterium]